MTASAAPATYFFLSYAHSAPLLEDPSRNPDQWVNVFFDHLSRAVRESLGLADTAEAVGFLDARLPLGSDWRGALAEALGSAQVFVPLYSPGYFANSWPSGELEMFRRRLGAQAASADRHIQPVLWSPIPSWEEPDAIRAALEVGGGSAKYADNGMRALCMLTSHKEKPEAQEYFKIVSRLAERIADVVRREPPIQVSPVDLNELSQTTADKPLFVVAVLAPTLANIPPDRDRGGYADRAVDWRPFGAQQAVPAADYVRNVAERLGLPCQLTDFADVGDALAVMPGVVLIDPWILESGLSEPDLVEVLRRLPQWAIPLVIVSDTDPQQAVGGAALADRLKARILRSGRGKAPSAGSLEAFLSLLSSLVVEARRQYLKHAPVFPPEPTAEQPFRLPRTRPTSASSTTQEER
jgi:FxsC-like protein